MSEKIKAYGLEGVIAGDTTISAVQQTGLWYRGYSIEDLAKNATFEETAFLILYGELPRRGELQAFGARLNSARPAAQSAVKMIANLPPATPLMDVLRTGISYLAHFDSQTDDNSREANLAKAERVIAQAAEIIPAWLRLREGKKPVPPREGLSHAAQILWELYEKEPSAEAASILDMTLILYAEHEFNASTFTARTIVSTLSDLHSGVTGAIGALKGPLHGGANEKAMDMIEAMQTPAQAKQWMLDQLAQKARIMGFGHRVYKHGDHRAVILGERAKQLATHYPERDWAGIYDAMVNTMREQKGMHPNLDFPCGLAYLLLGFPRDICTPLFVAARLSGWCAHITEQLSHNRLIRPLSEYTGPAFRPWKPIGER